MHSNKKIIEAMESIKIVTENFLKLLFNFPPMKISFLIKNNMLIGNFDKNTVQVFGVDKIVYFWGEPHFSFFKKDKIVSPYNGKTIFPSTLSVNDESSSFICSYTISTVRHGLLLLHQQLKEGEINFKKAIKESFLLFKLFFIK